MAKHTACDCTNQNGKTTNMACLCHARRFHPFQTPPIATGTAYCSPTGPSCFAVCCLSPASSCLLTAKCHVHTWTTACIHGSSCCRTLRMCQRSPATQIITAPQLHVQQVLLQMQHTQLHSALPRPFLLQLLITHHPSSSCASAAAAAAATCSAGYTAAAAQHCKPANPAAAALIRCPGTQSSSPDSPAPSHHHQ